MEYTIMRMQWDANCVTAVVLSKMLTRLISVVNSLSFYTTFCHPILLKPCRQYLFYCDVTNDIRTLPLVLVIVASRSICFFFQAIPIPIAAGRGLQRKRKIN